MTTGCAPQRGRSRWGDDARRAATRLRAVSSPGGPHGARGHVRRADIPRWSDSGCGTCYGLSSWPDGEADRPVTGCAAVRRRVRGHHHWIPATPRRWQPRPDRPNRRAAGLRLCGGVMRRGGSDGVAVPARRTAQSAGRAVVATSALDPRQRGTPGGCRGVVVHPIVPLDEWWPEPPSPGRSCPLYPRRSSRRTVRPSPTDARGRIPMALRLLGGASSDCADDGLPRVGRRLPFIGTDHAVFPVPSGLSDERGRLVVADHLMQRGEEPPDGIHALRLRAAPCWHISSHVRRFRETLPV